VSLQAFLHEVDLDAIYSTDYLRTLGTAAPVSNSKNLEIQLYDPKKLEDFAKQLLIGKEDAMVVGHSNSTSALAGYLVGSTFASIDETVYDRIYQVVVYKDKARVHLLQSSFRCDPDE
jgi:broad specificity phosphatase PhoE